MIKIRKFPEHNYKGIYYNNKTLRIPLDPSKPIGELDYPEFYDIKITGKCSGNCPWCYMDSTKDGIHYSNILDKCRNFFGSMNLNERPFQIALGGGNPNEHPDFISLLKLLSNLKITPNYTTNGMGLTEEILDVTKKYCGGVAISAHSHLEDIWKKAVITCSKRNICTNIHLIISDKKSIDYFISTYNEFKDVVKYFVLLPYLVQGRAEVKNLDYDYLFSEIKHISNIDQLAFGAHFFERLKKEKLDVSLYEPEILSKYLDLKDMTLYKSSFALDRPIKKVLI